MYFLVELLVGKNTKSVRIKILTISKDLVFICFVTLNLHLFVWYFRNLFNLDVTKLLINCNP